MFMTDCNDLGLKRLDTFAKEQTSATFELLRTAISECQRDGNVYPGDAGAIAASVWASVHGFSSLLLTGNLGSTEEEAENLSELHITHTLRGLRP
jgi:hypothetical protein